MTAVDTLATNHQAVFLRLLRKEQAKMTAQVPLVGSDGLIAGSDTKTLDHITTPGVAADLPLEFQVGSESKFLLNLDRGVVCGIAGTYEALTIGRNIRNDPTPLSPLTGLQSHQEWRDSLQAIADSVPMPENSAAGAEIIVMRVDTPTMCWQLSKFPGAPAHCRPVDHGCTGSRVSARFIPQHLWQHQSVKDLKKLALLTLAFAERENAMVGGDYEILSLTSAGFNLERFANADVKKWAATFLEKLQSLADTYEMNLVSTDVPLR